MVFFIAWPWFLTGAVISGGLNFVVWRAKQAKWAEMNYSTHEVSNQAGELTGFNAYEADAALQHAMSVFGGAWAEARLKKTGALIGSARMAELARAANRYVPELKTHDRFGNRIDMVDYHPAWHELMGLLRAGESHSLGWTAGRPGAQVARAGLAYLWGQGEPGVGCPATMTFASIGALKHAPDILAQFGNGILSPDYDPRPLPAEQKTALSVGMAMTEKQGGSDLRQTQTEAVPAGRLTGPGAKYLLTGHKWFFSVPTSDLFLTLARSGEKISCFLARGWLEDGSRNRILIQRLKEKCGNRSNASSEIEFRDLEAVMIGEEGAGIRTLLEMAHLTRLECAIGSAALMRQAVAQAIHHASHRVAFQRALVDQKMMTNVLADLALESEAAMWLAMRAAAALDAGESEGALNRILTPVAKYWVCRRAPAVAAEVLEVHGGNGFVEDHCIARLYREAPLNGVWEGSGNVICLDVMRGIGRAPESAAALRREIALAKGMHPALDAALKTLDAMLAAPGDFEANGRRIVEHMALAVSGSLLLRHAPAVVSGAFCESRLAGDRGMALGTLPPGLLLREIIDRAAVIGC
jgi:putative acyl-CoA dehydrogenase